jgi:hypothetical protein
MTTQARLLFERASHGVDANTAEGASALSCCSVREAKPNEGMLLQNIPRQVTKHGCDFPAIWHCALPESTSAGERQPPTLKHPFMD